MKEGTKAWKTINDEKRGHQSKMDKKKYTKHIFISHNIYTWHIKAQTNNIVSPDRRWRLVRIYSL